MLHILVPKTYIDIDPNTPVFFLAGPVRGGDDWQKQCCDFLENKLSGRDFYVAIPYFLDILPQDHIARTQSIKGDETYFPRQLNWERYYIHLASKQGCLIFWLPEESKTNPRTGGGPYATDTRGELGEWRGRMMYETHAHVVIGGQEGFEGLDIIKRNFKQALGDTFHIPETLEEVVDIAISKIENSIQDDNSML